MKTKSKISIYIYCYLLTISTSAYSQTIRILNTERVTRIESSYPFWSPDDNQIVFQSNRAGGLSDVYVMDTSGENTRRLTKSMGYDETPVWSPDGKQIAFQSTRDGNEELYVMDADGSNQRNLTYSDTSEMHPKWHPDSKKLLFSAQTGYWNLVDHWQISVDGTELERLTRNVTIDTYSSWSPNGKQIVGRRIIGVNSEIFLFDSAGNNAKNLTNNDAFDGWPAWHPSGTSIAYASENDEGEAAIYKLDLATLKSAQIFSRPGSWTKPIWNSDGTQLICTRTLNDNVDIFIYTPAAIKREERLNKVSKLSNSNPTLSPDGKKIAFHSNRFGNNDIFLINVDGSGLKRLTTSPGNDRTPSWSADGSKISFVSTRGGNYDVYVMNADGSKQRNLTNKIDSKQIHPYWLNDTNKIIFNSSEENDNYGIYTIKSDGSELKRIERNGAENTHAKISPDGKKIIFRKLIEKEDWKSDIFVMDRNGKNETRLTFNALSNSAPSWSPDGSKILFSGTDKQNNSTHLYLMNIDGTDIQLLTNDDDKNVHYLTPSFSGDGHSIIASLRDSGNEDVVVLRLEQ